MGAHSGGQSMPERCSLSSIPQQHGADPQHHFCLKDALETQKKDSQHVIGTMTRYTVFRRLEFRNRHVLGLLLTALSLSGCQLIQDQLDGNQAPALSDLVASPAERSSTPAGGLQLEHNIEGYLSCARLDERQRIEELWRSPTPSTPSKSRYTVMLRVDDGLNTAAGSVAVRVLEAEVKRRE